MLNSQIKQLCQFWVRNALLDCPQSFFQKEQKERKLSVIRVEEEANESRRRNGKKKQKNEPKENVTKNERETCEPQAP